MALVVVLVACLPACDGSGPVSDVSDDPSQAESQLTREQFAAQVDAVCEADRGRLTGLQPPRAVDEAAEFLRQVLPVIRDQLNRIRELGQPPEADSATYLDWFQARDGIVATTAAMIAAAEKGDRDQFQRLAVLQDELDERADDLADAYGFESCGGGGGATP